MKPKDSKAVQDLDTEQAMAAYLSDALAVGDATQVAAALGDIARLQGMAVVARQAGLGRESLYKTLSSKGNPELATVLKVISALGFRLRAEVAT